MPQSSPATTDSRPPLLLHVFPTFAVGGAQARFCAIANRLGPAYRHAIVALDGVTACRERLDPAVDATFPEFVLRKGTVTGNLRAIRAFLATLAPQTLVTSNWGAIEFAMANAWPPRVRHVHMEDGFGPEERATQLPRRVWTRRLVLRRSAIMLPSRTLLALARDTWRLPPARLHCVPNGVDLARYYPGTKPPGRIVVGTVAALRPEKNLPRLLRAVAAVPDVDLAIAGDGPERPTLESLAETLGIAGRTRFVGHLSDPAAFYRSLDVFALSSDTEQMPLSVLEAMATGLPIAATDVGDVGAMVGDANQALVRSLADANGLAQSLASLAADPALRRRLGHANRERAQSVFDEDLMVRRHAALWDGRPPA